MIALDVVLSNAVLQRLSYTLSTVLSTGNLAATLVGENQLSPAWQGGVEYPCPFDT